MCSSDLGGAYISTSTGIGTTNPLQSLHVLGNLLVAAGSSTGQHITQKAYELNSGTLSWEGSAGQLFSITNSLTSGSIFSVNDVSGIPSIDVNADGTIALAPYGTTERVGVGTTAPTAKLDVIGNARVTGVITATTFNGQVNAGVSTLGITSTTNLTTQNINNSGITTTNSLNIGATQVISSGRQLQNIASLDATTTATIESAIANAPNTFNDLNVTGISTLGITSTTNLTTQQLNVSGVSTFAGIATHTASLFGTQASFSGIVTGNTFVGQINAGVGTITTLSGTTATYGTGSFTTGNIVTGVVTTLTSTNATLTNINSSGISTLGITSTTNLTTQQLNVSGVSTHTGVSTFQSTLFGTQASFTGVVTANSYRGDGSQLTGLVPNTVATSSTTSPQYIGFLTASSGVTTNLQASSTLVYIPSSGNLGIGTTNPSNTLTVVGSGTSTSQLFVTGVSTFTGQFQSTQANSTTTGGGQIYLNGATGNRIDFNQNGVAAPAFTTRSAGTKLVLYPNISGTTVDYALGIENSTLWYSIDLANSTKQHRWYAGTTQLADLKGSGELVIGSTSLTGTASQALQVNSGAYVSGNLGIGTTNPQASLQVQGGANITGVTTIGVLNTSGTILNPTTAQSIVSIGQSALLNNTAINNVAVGQLALNTNTVGAYNVAIGVQALSKNTIGQYQVAVGYQALLTNTSGGYFNTALGAQTLLNNSTGYQNTAVGNFALAYNQTGINNVAVGAYALLNPTGSSNNNVIGFNALQAVGAGSSNNVFGTNALFNATGNYNVAIGESAGVGQTSGNFNVIIGASQNTPILTGSNQLVIGAGNTAWISGNSSYNVGIEIGRAHV